MPYIMSSFIFQASRRALLSHLLNTFDDVSRHRNEHTELGTHESDDEKRHIDNLLSAVKAAEEQVRKLEYWSDVREMAASDESKSMMDNEHERDHRWERFHGSESREVVPIEDEKQNAISRYLADKGKGIVR